MANGRKLFCWNGTLLLNFALVNAQEHWKRERKKNHLPFNLCILAACRLRISALGAHTPTCQALDLPTEFNPQDAPTLVSGLPKAISGLLQFAGLLPQARSPQAVPTALGERQGCLTPSASCSPNPCLAAIRIRAFFWWNTLNAVFYLNLVFPLTLLPLLFSPFHFGYSSLSFDPLPASFSLPPTCPVCSTTTAVEGWRNRGEEASAQLPHSSSLGTEPLTRAIFNSSAENKERISLFTAIFNTAEKV